MDYTLPQLLKTVIEQRASDLHIAANSPPRIRIDGQLIPLNLPPLSPQEAMTLCYSVLTEEQKKIFEKRKEIDLSFEIKKISRFRANIYYENHNIAGAFRTIAQVIPTISGLGLPQILYSLCNKPKGLVLVTGPTGSGKSTTLAAMINHINETLYGHIVSLEEPIEIVHLHKTCLVNQRELGEDTDDINLALKSLLRQDPDVAMLGELRDLDMIKAALTIAETGHLVFATLHTNDAVSSLNRIIDVFPPHQQSQIRTQLSMTLEAVISQLLLPTTKTGRALAMEILIANNPIKALINEGKFNQIYSVMQTGQTETHMQTMNQSLVSLVKTGIVNKDVALHCSSKKEEFLEMMSRRG
ncbi:MAG: type IV pilus twitching motility protein PilT [Oligoflexales bacterium]|nr:type IV pilus twitching motility protein PilT [Oligoflexales bacterium]